MEVWPPGLESFTPPLGYAGQQPARFVALSEPVGQASYLRCLGHQRSPPGCAQQLAAAKEREQRGKRTRLGTATCLATRNEGRPL